jgi:hypothetical protein
LISQAIDFKEIAVPPESTWLDDILALPVQSDFPKTPRGSRYALA